ncbi:hypothetical protein U1Q18_000497 [Sarracenia purpurea var. burkii]
MTKKYDIDFSAWNRIADADVGQIVETTVLVLLLALITPLALLPSTYQGHKDINAWLPFLYGNGVLVVPYLVVVLNQD